MRRIFPLLIAVFFFGAVTGSPGQALCAPSIVVAVEALPRTMNPHGSNQDSNLSVMANFFEGLMQRRGSGGTLVPSLALRYEHPDLLSWKLYLRKGIRFHNGNPFNADDVKFSFERLSDPQVSEFTHIGKAIDTINPIDDYTVIIKTRRPIPWFANNFYKVFIMDKESTEARDPEEVKDRPIGTGAYKFVEWAKGSYIKMEANKHYWEGTPSIKSVELKKIAGSSARFDALLSGHVDLVSFMPGQVYEKLAQHLRFEVITCPARKSIFLALGNKLESPLSDIRVRKAIYMAINEDEIIKEIMKEYATPAAQIPDAATVGFNPFLERLPYNPKMAKDLLTEAGYENGFEITLSGPNDLFFQDETIIEAVARYLAKLGIKVKIDIKSRSILLPEIFHGKLECYLIGWFDSAFDMGRTFSKLMHTREIERGFGSLNGSNFSDHSIDAFLEYTNSIVDPGNRKIFLQALNKMAMVDKIACIPLHYQQDIYVIQKGRGIKFQPRPDRWIICKEISAW
jgi:peptide/nickel transport system substrate-binding protein